VIAPHLPPWPSSIIAPSEMLSHPGQCTAVGRSWLESLQAATRGFQNVSGWLVGLPNGLLKRIQPSGVSSFGVSQCHPMRLKSVWSHYIYRFCTVNSLFWSNWLALAMEAGKSWHTCSILNTLHYTSNTYRKESGSAFHAKQ
jgi:hypothetical protein